VGEQQNEGLTHPEGWQHHPKGWEPKWNKSGEREVQPVSTSSNLPFKRICLLQVDIRFQLLQLLFFSFFLSLFFLLSFLLFFFL
jgi:hypothetical protein